MIVPKRIMKEPWLFSRLKLKRLSYGRRKGWEELIEWCQHLEVCVKLELGRGLAWEEEVEDCVTVLLTGEMIAHIERNSLLFFFKWLWVYVSVCVFTMCVQVHGGHRRLSDLLELKLESHQT